MALALAGCATSVTVEYTRGADDATVLMDGGLTLTVPREHVSGLGNIPKWLDENWPDEYNSRLDEFYRLGEFPEEEYLSKAILSQPPSYFPMGDGDGGIMYYGVDMTFALDYTLDYDGRCIAEYPTRAQQAETLAMLDVGDTVTVKGEMWLGTARVTDGPTVDVSGGYILFDCSILAIEKGPDDSIPWLDVWHEGWNDVYRKVRQSVVAVAMGYPSSSSSAWAAGWVYEDGWVITAEHVVRGRSTVEILYAEDDGTAHAITIEAQVMGWDKLRDIAAVKLPDGVDLPAFERAEFTDEHANAPLMLMGYSGTNGFQRRAKEGYPDASSGELVEIRDRRGAGVLILEADLPAIRGDSGGVFVQRQGAAVGISQASSHFFNNGLGLPISEIKKVWERLKAGEHLNADGPSWWAY